VRELEEHRKEERALDSQEMLVEPLFQRELQVSPLLRSLELERRISTHDIWVYPLLC